MKVGHFGKKFSKGVRLEFFFANRVRKKKFKIASPVISFMTLKYKNLLILATKQGK